MTINWKAYTGTDEQIAEIKESEFIWKDVHGKESYMQNITDFMGRHHLARYLKERNCTHYWIIPDDPLRDMKIRQAQTGQPVYIRWKTLIAEYQVGHHWEDREVVTTTPDWNIPNAEYSFTPFEDYACFT